MEKIEITINPETGEMSFEVFGVTGSSCLELTAGLEDAFNPKVARTLKPSYRSKQNKGVQINGSKTTETTKNRTR